MFNDLPGIKDGSITVSDGSEREFRHLSVYVCGPPQSGKSALCESLIKRFSSCPKYIKSTKSTSSTNSTNSTNFNRGINIKSIRPVEGTAIKFWDFSSQSEYFINQEIFTATNLHVFVVLIDCRNSQDEWLEKTRYWLQYIVTQSPLSIKPRVMVIASHADEVKAFDEDGYSLEALLAMISMTLFPEFSNSLEVVSESIITANGIDCSTEGIKTICTQLITMVSQPDLRSLQSVPWLCTEILRVLEQSVKRDETRYLPWPDYCKVMDSITRDMGVLSIATHRLHELGEVYFDPTKLAGVVILDLNWFYNDVIGWLYLPARQLPALGQAGVVMFRILAENGPVKVSDIPNTQFFPDLSIDMLDVLEAFEICYGFEQAGVKMFVFPCMLRTQPNRTLWLKQEIFTVHLGLKFVCSNKTTIIPPSFFHRLQVRLRLDIGPRFSAGVSQVDSIWRYGTVCKLDNAIALIRLASDHQSIFVHVRGDSDSFKEVRALMQRIIKVIQCKTGGLCKGLNFNVEHCLYTDLQANELEPQTLPQSEVLTARERGAKCVFSLDGAVESLSRMLAFENDGKRKYFELGTLRCLYLLTSFMLDTSTFKFQELSKYIYPGMSELDRTPILLAQDIHDLKGMNKRV